MLLLKKKIYFFLKQMLLEKTKCVSVLRWSYRNFEKSQLFCFSFFLLLFVKCSFVCDTILLYLKDFIIFALFYFIFMLLNRLHPFYVSLLKELCVICSLSSHIQLSEVIFSATFVKMLYVLYSTLLFDKTLSPAKTKEK